MGCNHGEIAVLFVLFIVATINVTQGSRDIGSKIYDKINSYYACVQLANATHQIGCTSDYKGNRGVVYRVYDNTSLSWLLIKGNPQRPFVPLIDEELFTYDTMKKLSDTGDMSGALVVLRNSTQPENPYFTNGLLSKAFSPDPSCPMDDFGVYNGNKEYGGCNKVKWNKHGNGMSMEYYGVPIFGLHDQDEINRITKCSTQYNFENGSAKGYPMCGVEMKDFMFAAKDTPTCKRKSEMANPILSTYCDPLGDHNVVGTLYPLVKDEPDPDSVVVVSTKLDSTAFFHDLAPGADNGVTGIVVLLAVARVLGDYKRKMTARGVSVDDLKPMMFVFFNGETWDYIGSSRMVWDMEHNKFPYPEDRAPNDTTLMSKLNMSHIGHFIELSQLGLGKDGEVFLHSDPLSQKDEGVKKKVDTMMKYFKDSAAVTGTVVKEVDRSAGAAQPLPPASFQRFLLKRNTTPGVVVADHEKEFVNEYYNSRFDNTDYLGVDINGTHGNTYTRFLGSVPANLTKLAETVAHTVYKLASGGKKPVEDFKVPKNLVGDLLFCFLYSQSCPAFREVSDERNGPIIMQPYSRYVSIADQENPVTEMMRRLLHYYTGEWTGTHTGTLSAEWVNNCTGKTAGKSGKLPKAVSHFVVTREPEMGSEDRNMTYVCVEGSAYRTVALSPSFELKDYESREYSTWTESMWSSEVGIRMYLIADPTVEGVIFACGVLMALSSFALVFFARSKCGLLFTPMTTPVVAIAS